MDATSLTKKKFKEMFLAGKRFDGRDLLDLREIKIEYEVSNKAEGSVRVKLGKTEVVVGIKLGVGEPYPDSLDGGNLMVSADLLPLASPKFEGGPPKFQAIELPRLVDRAIRESGMIDLEKLSIEKGKKVWTIFIDIYPINDDGNLIDVSTIASILALRKTTIPKLDKDGNVKYKEKTKDKLPLSKEINPISFTFYKLGESIILDPTREEEEACDVRITWGISKWKGQYMINSCQKSGGVPFNEKEIFEIMNVIQKKYEQVSEKLKKFL